MEVEFDPDKARSNRTKHGVRFSDAEQALRDPMAVTIEDPDASGEQRFVTLGMDSMGCLLVVVYAHRSDAIRLISARKASAGERRSYMDA
jgi:uncharacterized DUF497 family protein